MRLIVIINNNREFDANITIRKGLVLYMEVYGINISNDKAIY